MSQDLLVGIETQLELAKELTKKLYQCPRQAIPRGFQTLPVPASTQTCMAELPSPPSPTLMDFWPLHCSIGPTWSLFLPETLFPWPLCPPLSSFYPTALTSPFCWLLLLLLLPDDGWTFSMLDPGPSPNRSLSSLSIVSFSNVSTEISTRHLKLNM